MHTLSQEAARAPAKAWTVASRFPFEKSARDSCSTRGHSAWSSTKTWCCTFLTCVFEFRCFETDSCTSIPGPSHCKRPCTFAVGGQTWQELTVAVGASQPGSDRPVQRTLCHVDREVGSDKNLVGRCGRARKTPLQDRRPGDRSVRLFSNKLPEQTWRGRARERPKRQESHGCSPCLAFS